MIYLYILRHTRSGLLWLGTAVKHPERHPPVVDHWKWDKLLLEDSKVELLQVRAFRSSDKADSRLAELRKEHLVKTSPKFVNSDCYRDESVPYTYLIQHTDTGQFYVGVKYGKNANPSKFFVDYFTSSRRVRELGWENFDVVEIRASRNARDREAHLLKQWYRKLGHTAFCELLLNRNTAPGIILDAETVARCVEKRSATWNNKSDEERAEIVAKRNAHWNNKSEKEKQAFRDKMSALQEGKTLSDHARERIQAGWDNMSAETRSRRSAKIRDANIGCTRSEEARASMRAAHARRSPEAKAAMTEKMRAAKLGKKRGPHSEEHRARLSEAHLRFHMNRKLKESNVH